MITNGPVNLNPRQKNNAYQLVSIITSTAKLSSTYGWQVNLKGTCKKKYVCTYTVNKFRQLEYS